MATSDSPLCPDWVFLNNSNVQSRLVQNLHAFTSTLDGLPILGIGAVEIPTKRSPRLSGVSSYGSLHLKEVLHVPSFICNVIGYPIISSDGYDVKGFFKGTITDSKGKNIAYFDPKRSLFTIRVRGPPTGPNLGPHVLKKGVAYMLRCYWDAAEQRKWQEHQNKNGRNDSTSTSSGAVDGVPFYTADEKVYLKKNSRDEYHFLLQHALNIDKEEDRAEGRLILRAFREKDASDGRSGDVEVDLEGCQANDSHSSTHFDWIEESYGSWNNFMLSHGLKPYDRDDIEQAEAIANAMTAQDEENIS